MWDKPPTILRSPELPRDRSAAGRVRNTGDKQVIVDARRVRLVDAKGKRIRVATARFLSGFAHGLYSPTQFGQVQNAFELQRLGVRVELGPGQVLPLSVSWRLVRGEAPPVRAEFGSISLPLPRS
jgi:hypothetical protein